MMDAAHFAFAHYSLGGVALAFVPVISPAAVAGRNAVYLVEVEAYQGTNEGLATPGLAHFAAPHFALPFGTRIPLGLVTFRWSDMGWIGEPGDSRRPNQTYDGIVLSPIEFGRQLPILADGGARGEASLGAIELANHDGQLDVTLLGAAIQGREVRIYRGPRLGPIRADSALFSPVLIAIATGWEVDADTVRILLRAKNYALDTPHQSRIYAGSGGLEGGADLKGKPFPRLLGRKRNIKGDLLDANYGTYRLGDTALTAVSAGRDGGAALTNDAIDHASYAALIAASITFGHYQTCLAEGVVRYNYGSEPPGTVTWDADGPGVSHADLFRLTMAKAGVTTAGFDTSSVDAWPDGRAGLYIGSDERPSSAEVLDRIAAGVVATWGATRHGRLTTWRLRNPDAAQVEMRLAQSDLAGEVTPIGAPSTPRYRQRVAYRHLAHVQDASEMAGSVALTPEQAALYTTPFRIASPSAAYDADLLIRYPEAGDPEPIESLFDEEADADALAIEIHALTRVSRSLYRVPCTAEGYLAEYGTIVNLTYERFGLTAGRNGIVWGDEIDRDDVDLIVWV